MTRNFLLPLAALTMVVSPMAAPALAAQSTDKKQDKADSAQSARIPFADTIGVWDWRAEGRSTVYIQDNHKQWYKAELFSPSPDLPFVQFIGIDAGPTGTLDKWGAVYIHGIRYPFKSFVKVDGPPTKKKD